jgi:hypothetical protein
MNVWSASSECQNIKHSCIRAHAYIWQYSNMEPVMHSSFLTITWQGLLMFLCKVHHHNLLQFIFPQAHNKRSDAGFIHKNEHPLSFAHETSDLQNQISYKFWHMVPGLTKVCTACCVASSAMLPHLTKDSSETGNPSRKKWVGEQDSATTQILILGHTMHCNTAHHSTPYNWLHKIGDKRK